MPLMRCVSHQRCDMSSNRMFRYLALGASVLAGLSCGDLALPTSPTSVKAVSPTAPGGVSFSRYILISGVWTCVQDCEIDNK